MHVIKDMESSIYQLMYISSATPALTEEALLGILSESQARNAANDITGLLLHADGNIIQIIEGEKTKVEALFDKVSADTRHKHIMVLSKTFVEKRDFPHFHMGFERANAEQLAEELPAFTDIVENKALSPDKLRGLSKRVSVFLKTFALSTKISRSR